MLHNKRILLIMGGGVAAYKSLDLIRRLRERGIQVRAILTRAGAEFVTPLAVASLSGEKCYSDLFSLTDEAEMGHIRLSREADLVLVAPATADLMAKMANGLANDLASTALLATDKQVMLAPAMNVQMWNNPATRRNVETLKADGVLMVGPDDGLMACGETGAGRLSSVEDILASVDTFFTSESALRPLAGKKALVTAGPTHEPIDPVRYLANRSSGKQGYAIAASLAALGADVTLVSGPTALPTPAGVKRVDVERATEMAQACDNALPVDIAVCVAAVADWRVESEQAGKIKKTSDGVPPAFAFVENPDILAHLSGLATDRPALVIGFAAETDNVLKRAKDKRQRKGCDWIIANDVSPTSGIMGGDETSVTLITGDGLEQWPQSSKTEVAGKLALRIVDYFSSLPS